MSSAGSGSGAAAGYNLAGQIRSALGRANASFAANLARAGVSGGPAAAVVRPGAAAALITAPVSLSDQFQMVLVRAGVSLPAATAAKKEVEAAGVFSGAAAPAPAAAAAAPPSALKKSTEQALQTLLDASLPDGSGKWRDLTPDQFSELLDGGHLYGPEVTQHATDIRLLQMALPGLAGGARRRKGRKSRRATRRRRTVRRAKHTRR